LRRIERTQAAGKPAADRKDGACAPVRSKI
jgi:hypothetical protein